MSTVAEAPEVVEAFDPNKLLDYLITHLRVKNDAGLACALETPPPVISKIRHGRQPVGATILLRMHEVSEIPLKELRALMGDRRRHFRATRSAGGQEE